MQQLFFYSSARGLKQGRSVDTVGRANKAPAGLCLARGGDPPYALPRPHAPAALATAVFLYSSAQGDSNSGGSVDIVSRANKAPAGLCLAGEWLAPCALPRPALITESNSYFFIFQCPGDSNRAALLAPVSRANKALHRIRPRSLSKNRYQTPAPRLNLCRGSASYRTVRLLRKEAMDFQTHLYRFGRWSSCWRRFQGDHLYRFFQAESPAGGRATRCFCLNVVCKTSFYTHKAGGSASVLQSRRLILLSLVHLLQDLTGLGIGKALPLQCSPDLLIRAAQRSFSRAADSGRSTLF